MAGWGWKVREEGGNVWIGRGCNPELSERTASAPYYTVMENEEEVGLAMYRELEEYSRRKEGDLVVVLLGGRGAQAMYKHLSRLAATEEIDALLGRLHVITQDGLAPMGLQNGFGFVRDFERLLGPHFFAKVKSFVPMNTESDDLQAELTGYLARIELLGGIDIFFLGFGPEPHDASHLCYIKPGSGAQAGDLGGIIPISRSILEHHINKFKAGGCTASAEDEAQCRQCSSILTLGPAAILGARLVVQSIVDASSAPAKIPSFQRFLTTPLVPADSHLQCDQNPGLWARFHPHLKCFILADLLLEE